MAQAGPQSRPLPTIEDMAPTLESLLASFTEPFELDDIIDMRFEGCTPFTVVINHPLLAGRVIKNGICQELNGVKTEHLKGYLNQPTVTLVQLFQTHKEIMQNKTIIDAMILPALKNGGHANLLKANDFLRSLYDQNPSMAVLFTTLAHYKETSTYPNLHQPMPRMK